MQNKSIQKMMRKERKMDKSPSIEKIEKSK
jgi:hypothetical protein